MGTRLIIAEKPDMGRKIAAALPKPHKTGNGFIEVGNGDIVSWCIGHIMKSFNPEEYNEQWGKWSFDALPMIVTDWKIKIDPDKSKQFKTIKELLGRVDSVVNAGDPGREGQLIVDEVLHYLKNKKPVQRILLYALNPKSILEAFEKLEDNEKYFPLYQAGICRGYADWLMGMNATRAYTLLAQKSGYKGVLSVGRVQSPTLAIVVHRDRDIANFKPKDYFLVSGVFNHKGHKFSASFQLPEELINTDKADSDGRIIDKAYATSISDKISNKNAKVVEYTEREGKDNQPLPFNLSKMQIFANSKWGYSAKEVLEICQALYEKHELQTYPRTDCQYLPENQHSDATDILAHISKSIPEFSKACQGADTSIQSPAWDDKKLGEHFGLIPTKKAADLSSLNEKEKNIYKVVCERYISQFYPACEYKSASVILDCEDETFKAGGRVVIKSGWRGVFNFDDEDTPDEGAENQIFPEMREGEDVSCETGVMKSKITTAPPLMTEGSLIKAMTNIHTLVSDPEQKKKLKEKKGIGQEATRAHILDGLIRRGLLLKQGKNIISSEAGRTLIHALPKKVIDPALTAVWEDALDKIADGKASSQSFMTMQQKWVEQIISEAKQTNIETIHSPSSSQTKNSSNFSKSGASKTTTTKKASGAPKKSKGSCPKCNVGEMIERVAKASGKKFLGCNNWPKCDHVKW